MPSSRLPYARLEIPDLCAILGVKIILFGAVVCCFLKRLPSRMKIVDDRKVKRVQYQLPCNPVQFFCSVAGDVPSTQSNSIISTVAGNYKTARKRIDMCQKIRESTSGSKPKPKRKRDESIALQVISWHVESAPAVWIFPGFIRGCTRHF